LLQITGKELKRVPISISVFWKELAIKS
jgi:hypothetical protein